MARDSGFSEFDAEVEEIDPWGTRISKIQMHKKEQMSLAVEQVQLFYAPASVAQGKLDAVSMTGLELDFKADAETSADRPETDSPESMEETLVQFLEAPYVTHLRIRDSKLKVNWKKHFSMCIIFCKKENFRFCLLEQGLHNSGIFLFQI